MKKIYISLFLLISAIGYSQTTAIPDANFEQALIDQEIDSDGIINGQVLTADIAGVTVLNIGNLGITDLTGIEGFTALTDLNARVNLFTSLDVTQNTALRSISMDSVPVESLDVTQNPALVSLNIFNNNISSLDLTQNPELSLLFASDNQLTDIDVTQNPALTFLGLNNNQITSIDVSQNIALETLAMSGNQLTFLDVSINGDLSSIDVSNNESLIGLNVQNGNNESFQEFFTIGNPNLACIQVDDVSIEAAASEIPSFSFDPGVEFSLDCGFLSTDEFVLRDVVLFPNPTSSVLNITIPSNAVLERINIYNSVGQSVGSTQETAISVSNLSDGIYFLEVVTDKGLTTSRFIKN